MYRRGTYTRTELAEAVENTIENDEKGKDGSDLLQSATNDKSKDGPDDEA